MGEAGRIAQALASRNEVPVLKPANLWPDHAPTLPM